MLRIILFLILTLLSQSFHFGQKEKIIETDPPANNYPIRAVYIDRSQYWYGDKIAIALGVPGYAPAHEYNYILLAFWSCMNNPQDMALVWSDAYKFFAQGNSFGQDTPSIQKALRAKYNQAGIKIMVSAFGATEFPTSGGLDPHVCAQKLGNFVKENNLDGADIDWEDNQAMKRGDGQAWLIQFTKTLRAELPNHIITHAPQAPYFKNEYYKNGGYKTIHDKVGNLIDFYMVQFYNQVETKYDSFEELFIHSSGPDFNGTAIKEINERGIPLRKIVVGKPILPSDASNTGWVNQTELGSIAMKGFQKLGWYAGIMHWQYPSDLSGASIVQAAGALINKCKATKECV